jgi:predicted CoA-binding protein
LKKREAAYLGKPSEMLAKKVWAVVGASNNKTKFGYKIFKTMREAGFEVYPVNPGLEQILGCTCYPSLKDLPVKPEAVNIVVPPRVGEQIIQDCAKLNIANVWFQPGADGEKVVSTARQLGLNVIENACIMVEIRKKKE